MFPPAEVFNCWTYDNVLKLNTTNQPGNGKPEFKVPPANPCRESGDIAIPFKSKTRVYVVELKKAPVIALNLATAELA